MTSAFPSGGIAVALAAPMSPRSGSWLAIALAAYWFAGAAPAQGAPRLVDAVEAPMLYLALGAAPAGGEPAVGQRHAVQRLLADPAFDSVLGAIAHADAAPAADSSSTRALALVRSVLSKSSGAIEIALTGVVPARGQPLLVLRAELQAEESGRLRVAIADGRLAARHRVLGGHQTYAMLGADDKAAAGAGEQVELAIVGNDLVVANDMSAIEELLEPGRTTAGRRVLATDPRFTRLRERLAVPAGSLVVYGDWPRLAQRLHASGEDEALGLPSFALRWSGLGSARGVMAALSGDDKGFTGTVLFDFEKRSPRDSGPPPHPGRGPGPGSAIDGWFAAALSLPATTLLADLPGGGLGSLVLAVDLRDVAARSHRGADLLLQLRAAFQDFGLDFDRNVRERLGERGTVQLLFRRAAGKAVTEIDSVYSVRATSRAAAGYLFQDLRRAAEQSGAGQLVPGRARRGIEVLELRSPRVAGHATYVAVQDAAVLVCFDPTVIDDYLDEARKAQSQRRRRDAEVGKVLSRIGGGEVSGLFDLDLTPWFDRIGELLAAGGAPIDLSGIPRRHIGYLDLQPSEAGMVLRVCVLSSR
jgi:hypothetical protein